MAVVGIDFGNSNCYISVARAGGIECIANDYSLRETPSVVGFSERQRIMGVSAKNQMLTNLKKTVFGFKHMLGRKYLDPVVQECLVGLPFGVNEGADGGVKIQVDYLGEKQSFSPEELTAMLLTKLKHTAEEALKTKVKDVVISCPCYFTDCERRALLDAASIAGLNVLKLMNDTTSTALAYGIYKQDLPAAEEKARNVVFVDVGNVGIQVAACSFHKGKLVVKACTFERGCGGKAFDAALVKYFADDFKSKYKMDPMSNPRAVLKLSAEVEKVKKQMSANTNRLPLNIECFMEERDLSCCVDRATFEQLVDNQLRRVEHVLKECLLASEWKREDIYAVEVVGGSTRIPAIKTVCERIFGKVPNTTLNADESVSRGCALQCAILSPTFKVREFSVTDIQPYPIKIHWKAEQDAGDMIVFPRFHQVPFSKLLTFYRRENFTVEAAYDDNEMTDIPLLDRRIGSFEIGEVRPLADGGNQKVKIKVRINLNGVFAVTSASFMEKHEIEEEVPMETEEQQQQQPNMEEAAKGEKTETSVETNEGDMKSDEGEKPSNPPKMIKQKKTVSKTVDLPVTPRVAGTLSRDRLSASQAQESRFVNLDVNESDRLNAKNAMEEYIYDIRSKVNDELEDYMSEESRGQYFNQLEDAENWLYEDGEDCDKAMYVDKLRDLKMVGEAAKKRKTEYEGRKGAIESLGHALQMASKISEAAKAGDIEYNHLAPEELEKVAKLVDEKKDWMDKNCAALEKTDKCSNPSVLVCQFYSEKNAFEAVVNPILNKPKPEPPVAPAAKEDSIKTSLPSKEAPEGMDLEHATAAVNGKDQSMELD